MRAILTLVIFAFLLTALQAEKCSVGCNSCPWKASFFKVKKGSCNFQRTSIHKTFTSSLEACRGKKGCKVLVIRKKCPKGFVYGRKIKRCFRKCPKGQRFGRKGKKCYTRKCSKRQRFSKKHKKCVAKRCPRGFRWLKKTKRCFRKARCPKGFRWSKMGRRCAKRGCPRGQRRDKATKKCVAKVPKVRPCPKGQKMSKKSKKCFRKRCPRRFKWSKKNHRCYRKRCPRRFTWSKKTKRCFRKGCGRGNRWSKKQKKCVPRGCPKGQKWSKKSKKCFVAKCKRTHRLSKKSKKCILKRCPKKFRWVKKTKRCIRRCDKGKKWSRKAKKCVGKRRKCPKGTKWNKKAKRCGCRSGQVFNKKSKRCQRPKPVKRITCDLYADPHVRGFTGRRFEAQTVGDWLLYKGARMSVHYRGKRFGGWVGPIQYGVKIGKHVLRSVGFQKVSLNGQDLALPEGKKVSVGTNGAYVLRRGNKFTFSTNDGEEVDFVSYGSFFNAYVRSSSPKVKGICAQQFIGSKFFGHPQKPKIVKPKKVPCPKRKNFIKHCAKKGLKGRNLKFCVRDLCNGLTKVIEDKILKEKKKENKKKLKKPKRVNRITCDLYADPHVKGFSGKRYEAQTVGDWLLYRGEKMSAHYRGKRFGGWVGPIQYGVRIGQDILRNVGFTGVSLNGKAINLVNGKRFNLATGGFVVKHNNRFTFSTNDGEEVVFVSGGYYFNAYVRSNSPRVKGICSQQFIRSKFFTHPVKGKIITIKRGKCPKRVQYRAHCLRKGQRGTNLKNCVKDLCNGMKKKTEDRILKEKKRQNKKVLRKPKPVHRITCDLYADPHVKGFSGRRFEAQTVGDWVLYRGPALSAHYRGKRFGGWVGPIQFGVRVNGDVVRSVGFTQVSVNGKIVNLVNGKNHALASGAFVRKTANRFTISSGNGEEVEFIAYGYFFNAFVRSSAPSIAGICSQQFIRSNFFGHPVRGTIIRPKKVACPRRARYQAHCAARGLRNVHLKQCVADMCNGLPRKIEDRIIKRNKKENKKRTHRFRVRKLPKRIIRRAPTPRRVVVRRVPTPRRQVVRRAPTPRRVVVRRAPAPRRVVVRRAPTPRRQVVRRAPTPRVVVRNSWRPAPRPAARRRGRGRSDVHLGLRGKDITESFVGIFTFFSTKKTTAQVKYTKFGNGNAITGFATRSGKSVLHVSTVSKKLVVEFNGKKLKRGEQRLTKTIDVKRGNRRSEILVAVKGQYRGSIVFDPVTKALDVNINIDDVVKSYGGIIKNGKQRPNIVQKKDSLFKDYVAVAKVSMKENPKFAKKAKKWCRKVAKEFKKDCRKDVMVTGVNWSNNYKLEKKEQNDALRRNAFRRKAKVSHLKLVKRGKKTLRITVLRRSRVRMSQRRRLVYRFGTYIRRLCRRGVVVKATPVKMVASLWKRYKRSMRKSKRNFRLLSVVSKKFVRVYTKKLLSQQCQTCLCSNVLKGKKLRRVQRKALRRCRKM